MNETWKPPDPYTLDWHTEACKCYAEGKPNPPITDEPITGYFRASMRKDGEFVPVAYFYDPPNTVQLLCEVDGDLFEDGQNLPNGQSLRQFWPYASKRPITIEQYDYYMKHGRWPEMSEAVHLSNNPPPDMHPASVEFLETRISVLTEEANRFLANKPAKTQEECNQASVLIGKLAEFPDEDKDAREWAKRFLETEPSISPAIKSAVEFYQSMWTRALNALKATAVRKSVKQDYQKPFLVALKAEYKARGEKMPVQHAVLGYPATKLSAQKKARIDDYEACLSVFKGHPKVMAVVQSLANAEVKSTKKAPPGCEVVEEDIAS